MTCLNCLGISECGLWIKGTGKFKSLVNISTSLSFANRHNKIITANRGKHKKGSEKLSKMYTCEQVAERYGVQIITIWDWIRKKKLPAIKIGKEYRISEDDIKAFEESRRTVSY